MSDLTVTNFIAIVLDARSTEAKTKQYNHTNWYNHYDFICYCAIIDRNMEIESV